MGVKSHPGTRLGVVLPEHDLHDGHGPSLSLPAPVSSLTCIPPPAQDAHSPLVLELPSSPSFPCPLIKCQVSAPAQGSTHSHSPSWSAPSCALKCPRAHPCPFLAFPPSTVARGV